MDAGPKPSRRLANFAPLPAPEPGFGFACRSPLATRHCRSNRHKHGLEFDANHCKQRRKDFLIATDLGYTTSRQEPPIPMAGLYFLGVRRLDAALHFHLCNKRLAPKSQVGLPTIRRFSPATHQSPLATYSSPNRNWGGLECCASY